MALNMDSSRSGVSNEQFVTDSLRCLCSARVLKNTQKHTHTHLHRYSHTQTHTQLHTPKRQTNTERHTHAHGDRHTHAHTHTHTHTQQTVKSKFKRVGRMKSPFVHLRSDF